jgi:predicted ArsR family transcriptional regulator
MGRPQRRGLPEEVRARIGELHRAGRSAYAISRELGVSYNAVRAHLRALEEAG